MNRNIEEGGSKLTRILVVYESKYGNTRLVAEKIIEGMTETEEIEAVLSEVKKVDLNDVVKYDAILIGSPNHIGRPTGSIGKFIDKVGKLGLKKKWTAVFDTYLGKDFEKAVKKMEKRISEEAPGLKIIAPGLSIRVQGMKGPITEGELTKAEEFGNQIATRSARATKEN